MSALSKKAPAPFSKSTNVRKGPLSRRYRFYLHPKKSSKCFYEDCQKAITGDGKYIEHLEKTHNLNLEKEKIVFTSFFKFLLWKEKEEDRIQSLFILHKTQARTCTSYICARHFAWTRSGTIRKYDKPEEKCICFSRILVKEVAPRLVVVDYIKTHLHPIQPLDYSICPSAARPIWIQQAVLGLADLLFPAEEILERVTQFSLIRSQRWKKNPGIEQTLALADIQRILAVGSTMAAEDRLEEILIEWSLEKDSPLILLKQKDVAMQIGPQLEMSLASSVEVYGFQSIAQRKIMQEESATFWEISVCDSTFSMFELYTVTVAVIRSGKHPYPIASFLVSSLDATVLSYCFLALKNRLGRSYLGSVLVQHESINPVIYAVFGAHIDVYMCQMTVWSIWEDELSKTQDSLLVRREITGVLKGLLSERDQETFKTLCINFEYKYYAHPFRKLFAKYFKPDMIPQWSAAWRPVQIPLTNIGTEYIETMMKWKYLGLTSNNEKYRLLMVIAELENGYYCLSQSGQRPTHEICGNCLVPKGNGKWDVTGCTRNVDLVKCRVVMSDGPCPRTDCKVYRDRPKLCIHVLSCTCSHIRLDCPHILFIYDLYQEDIPVSEPAILPSEIARLVLTDMTSASNVFELRTRIQKNCDEICAFSRGSKRIEVSRLIDKSLRDLISNVKFILGDHIEKPPTMSCNFSDDEKTVLKRLEFPDVVKPNRDSYNLKIKYPRTWAASFAADVVKEEEKVEAVFESQPVKLEDGATPAKRGRPSLNKSNSPKKKAATPPPVTTRKGARRAASDAAKAGIKAIVDDDEDDENMDDKPLISLMKSSTSAPSSSSPAKTTSTKESLVESAKKEDVIPKPRKLQRVVLKETSLGSILRKCKPAVVSAKPVVLKETKSSVDSKTKVSGKVGRKKQVVGRLNSSSEDEDPLSTL